MKKRRCKWVNLKNPLYIEYHDKEWGVPHYDDEYMFEFLVLESFQAGLSWECVLNKREAFKQAFDNFDYNKIIKYDEKKIEELGEAESDAEGLQQMRTLAKNMVFNEEYFFRKKKNMAFQKRKNQFLQILLDKK